MFRKALVVAMFLLLSPVAWALPAGVWVGEFEDGLVIVEISAERVKLSMEFEQGTVGFEAPLIEVREPNGEQPGRLVAGPVEDGRSAYEVLWFTAPANDRIRLDIAPEGFQTLPDAESSVLNYPSGEMTVMLSGELFEKTASYPSLPSLSREQFVELLKEAIALRAQEELDFVVLMQDLMLSKGYHPVRSGESFGVAVERFGQEPDIKALLSQLGFEE